MFVWALNASEREERRRRRVFMSLRRKRIQRKAEGQKEKCFKGFRGKKLLMRRVCERHRCLLKQKSSTGGEKQHRQNCYNPRVPLSASQQKHHHSHVAQWTGKLCQRESRVQCYLCLWNALSASVKPNDEEDIQICSSHFCLSRPAQKPHRSKANLTCQTFCHPHRAHRFSIFAVNSRLVFSFRSRCCILSDNMFFNS